MPIRLATDQPSALLALVDSGSEHTLAVRWLADDLGIDLDHSTDRLPLGIGGRSVEAVFAQVDLHLYREHHGDEYVLWRADVGFVQPWDAEFYLILGQTGFYDEFTVAMNRRLLTVLVQDIASPPAHGPPLNLRTCRPRSRRSRQIASPSARAACPQLSSLREQAIRGHRTFIQHFGRYRASSNITRCHDSWTKQHVRAHSNTRYTPQDRLIIARSRVRSPPGPPVSAAGHAE